MANKLSTEAYKGTRDFYPQDMAVQRYIFDMWANTAESFGFERYDASILEPSELYKSKGAENEELVNEQTYTFIDRGDREVTLRPEMTPTVARMVAGKRRELNFPVRWYSIPNLFRYERPQRGRLREHWQLNCDMFGINDISADVEMIALAYHTLTAFGATPDMFEIRINDVGGMQTVMTDANYFDLTSEKSLDLKRITDRKNKVSQEEFYRLVLDVFEKDEHKANLYLKSLESIGNDYFVWLANNAQNPVENPLVYTGYINTSNTLRRLNELGITNVKFDPTIARGFDYYTGIVFEVFDTSPENNRSMMGGGRYDNLTGLFDDDPISGIGFGMGDVIMRDFLETHGLLKNIPSTAPTLIVLPMDASLNLEGEKIAQQFRMTGISTSVDLSDRKIGKKLSVASNSGAQFVLVLGEDEVSSQTYTLKELVTKEETTGSIIELTNHIL